MAESRAGSYLCARLLVILEIKWTFVAILYAMVEINNGDFTGNRDHREAA
jgi:hypothetical protein